MADEREGPGSEEIAARTAIAARALRETFERGETLRTAAFVDEHLVEGLARFAAALASTVERGGRLFACGNGGSLADAMHFAAEWTGRFRDDRRAWPATALSDPVTMSCIANDYGWDQVFARQVEASGRAGDLLLVISTSGDSANVVRAAQTARARGLQCVGLLGRAGGKVATEVDLALVVPGATTADEVQGIHIHWIHGVLDAAERLLARERDASSAPPIAGARSAD